MEQKILVFRDNPSKGLAMERAKIESTQLAKEGWFVHDTCATAYWNPQFSKPLQEVMVTYRRKG
jgi:hypothetical protein